jgi:hypothetical protein
MDEIHSTRHSLITMPLKIFNDAYGPKQKGST